MLAAFMYITPALRKKLQNGGDVVQVKPSYLWERTQRRNAGKIALLENIRVNVICPGRTETKIQENTQQKDLDRIKFPVQYPKGQIPLGDGKPATAEQVAQVVVFLVSNAASHITGTEIWIDGGSSLVVG